MALLPDHHSGGRRRCRGNAALGSRRVGPCGLLQENIVTLQKKVLASRKMIAL